MINRQNYHWMKAHVTYLGEMLQLHPDSVLRYWFYLRHILLWADETSLSDAADLRPALPAYLSNPPAEADAEPQPLTPSSIRKVIQCARRFFVWAKITYPREFRVLPTAWVETLRPPRFSQAADEHEFVTLDEAVSLTRVAVPEADLALRRDQAAAAMLFLSGMRVGALGSLPIEAVDLNQRAIRQWPSLGVKTKNSKSATTYLLPIPELFSVVERWDKFVREQLPATAMWAAPIANHWGEFRLTAERGGASRNGGVNRRIQKLFELADLPPRSSHKFRHGHAVWALQHARTMADYKAISQNLMHGDIRVTDGIYAPLLGSEIAQRVAQLADRGYQQLPLSDDLAGYLSRLNHHDIPTALRLLADRLARA